jgi:hypothetical protein
VHHYALYQSLGRSLRLEVDPYVCSAGYEIKKPNEHDPQSRVRRPCQVTLTKCA